MKTGPHYHRSTTMPKGEYIFFFLQYRLLLYVRPSGQFIDNKLNLIPAFHRTCKPCVDAFIFKHTISLTLSALFCLPLSQSSAPVPTLPARSAASPSFLCFLNQSFRCHHQNSACLCSPNQSFRLRHWNSFYLWPPIQLSRPLEPLLPPPIPLLLLVSLCCHTLHRSQGCSRRSRLQILAMGPSSLPSSAAGHSSRQYIQPGICPAVVL